MHRDPAGRFFCERCTARFDAPGDCPTCPDEPLLDLTDVDIIHMLDDFDAAAQRKRFGLFFGVGLAAAVPTFLVLMMGAAALELRSGGKLALFAALGVLAVISGGLSAVFPAKKKRPLFLPQPAQAAQQAARAGIAPPPPPAPAPRPAAQAPVSSDRADGACASCGAPLVLRDAYLDDDGRPLCPTCFDAGQAAEAETIADRDEFGQVASMAVFGVVGADIVDDLRDDRRRARKARGED